MPRVGVARGMRLGWGGYVRAEFYPTFSFHQTSSAKAYRIERCHGGKKSGLPAIGICPLLPNVEGVAVVGVIAAIEGRLAALVSHEGFCEGYKNNAPHVPYTGVTGKISNRRRRASMQLRAVGLRANVCRSLCYNIQVVVFHALQRSQACVR